MNMEIKEIQEKIRSLTKVVNQKHEFPFPHVMSIMKAYEELGELTAHVIESTINTRKGEKISFEDAKKNVGNEIADIIIALLSLANDYSVDLEKSLESKLEKHFERWDRI